MRAQQPRPGKVTASAGLGQKQLIAGWRRCSLHGNSTAKFSKPLFCTVGLKECTTGRHLRRTSYGSARSNSTQFEPTADTLQQPGGLSGPKHRREERAGSKAGPEVWGRGAECQRAAGPLDHADITGSLPPMHTRTWTRSGCGRPWGTRLQGTQDKAGRQSQQVPGRQPNRSGASLLHSTSSSASHQVHSSADTSLAQPPPCRRADSAPAACGTGRVWPYRGAHSPPLRPLSTMFSP